MLKKWFLLLPISLMCLVMTPKIQAGKLKWRLDLIGGRKTVLMTLNKRIINIWKHRYYHFQESNNEWSEYRLESANGDFYMGKVMLFVNRFGIGTAILAGIDYWELTDGVFQGSDTTYLWYSRRYGGCSFFPIIMHCTFCSKPLDYGSIDLYGYLTALPWPSQHSFRFYKTEPPPAFDASAFISVRTSSYYDIGICLSLNLLKRIPVDFLRLGMIRINFPYKEIPKPYAEYVSPLGPTSYFYASLGFSLGYQK